LPLSFLCVSLTPRLPCSPLFPYTTLFRSLGPDAGEAAELVDQVLDRTFVHPATLRRSGPVVVLLVDDRPAEEPRHEGRADEAGVDRKSTRLNSSHVKISYAVFCLKKKKHN